MATSNRTNPIDISSSINKTSKRQLRFKHVTDAVSTESLKEYIQALVGKDEIELCTPAKANHDTPKKTRTLIITLRDPKNVDYFLSLRPHIINNYPVFVMRSIPAKYALSDVRTEYCLITIVDDNKNNKLDIESVHQFVNAFGMIKDLKHVTQGFLIQFEDYDSVDKLIINGEDRTINWTKVKVNKIEQSSVSDETMAYLTIAFQESDEAFLRPKLIEINNESCKLIFKNKCLSIIPGLVSRSCQSHDKVQLQKILTLFSGMPVWIKHSLKLDEEWNEHVSDQDVRLLEISFGYLQSNRIFLWKKKITNSSLLTWKTNIAQNYIAIKYQTEPVQQLRLTSDCLDSYFIISNTYARKYIVVLPLKTPPDCYDLSLWNGSITHSRTLKFDVFDESCLSNSSAMSIAFADEKSLSNFASTLEGLIKLEQYHGDIKCAAMSSSGPDQCDHELSDFWSSYAFQALLSLGYRIKDRITQQTLQKIHNDSQVARNRQYSNHSCYLKLMAIYQQAQQNRFFDINQEYDRIQPILPSVVLDKWIYVPRVYLTPYGVFPLPVKPMRGNRILREKDRFGPYKHFCRVILRDINCSSAREGFIKLNKEWIRKLIVGEEKLYVGNLEFQFLLCSNSQLKDRSFWFHAPYRNYTANDIRHWMGDLSHETCIGTYIARMAMTLTSTTESIKLTDNQIERIYDKKDHRERVFTDGAGKISPDALKQVLIAYSPDVVNDNYTPCVIQIRLNGLKGILVKAPDLQNRGVLIQYRPSQYKFGSTHNVLEIAKHFRSSKAFLNRQVVVLLEYMGVRKENFIQLQNRARLDISMSLLGNKITQNSKYFDLEKIRSAGVQLIKDPFSRSLILLQTRAKLKSLKEKSSIPIPESDGRILVGVVDETNSLRYGQVFIKLRPLNGKSQINHPRKVLITKNPAHFPGDIRILDAVDCPALHHLDECVVFPTQGSRPHPNEMSGGDTDGDEYWVCWNEDLVRSVTQVHDPVLFDAPVKSKHDGPITINEIAEFIIKYLSSDPLGRISNYHLALCAFDGAGNQKSLDLARIISNVVDFPKTGIPIEISNDVRPSKCPIFMEARNQASSVSKSSLDIMYLQIAAVWEIHSKWIAMVDEEQYGFDERFIFPGYRKYISQANEDYRYYSSMIDSILLKYNLIDEYELITGCHSHVVEEIKNNDTVETSIREHQDLLEEMRQRFTTDRLDSEEQKMKASAWYCVAYAAGTKLSFAWIMMQLMYDIAKIQRTVQKDQSVFELIGQCLYEQYREQEVKQLAKRYHIVNQEQENGSDLFRLGKQFQQIIELPSLSDTDQKIVHQLLLILHRFSLNNIQQIYNG